MRKASSLDVTNKTQGLAGEESMDKVKKLLSPGTKRKVISSVNKTFGVPLEELVRKAPPGSPVPFLVKKICNHLGTHGFDQEGLFRISGNVRIMEKLRQSFDQHGDADLEEDGDIMAVAGLLKLFLRELPESIIPEHMTSEFVAIEDGYSSDQAKCIHCMKLKLQEISKENYNLLKYIIGFLVAVTYYHSVNKMNAMALGIVFGPNLFRCGNSLQALKEQSFVNNLVLRFITDYDKIFKSDGEESPVVEWEKKKRVPPPRPPPPKSRCQSSQDRFPHLEGTATKMHTYDSSHYHDQQDLDHNKALIGNHFSPTGNLCSPRNSDDEFTDRASPFVLDSESCYSIVESPIQSGRNTEIVEKTISQTITEQLFGDSERSLCSTPSKEQTKSPTMEGLEASKDLNTSASNSVASEKSDDSSSIILGMKDRIRQFEMPGEQKVAASTSIKPAKQRPSSKAFDVFEEQGMIVIQAGGVSTNLKKVPHREAPQAQAPTSGTKRDISHLGDNINNNYSEMGICENGSSITSMEIGSASHPPISSNGSQRQLDEQLDELLQETEGITNNGYTTSFPGKHKHRASDDINHNQAKSRIGFLDLRPMDNHQVLKLNDRSPDRSPSNARKPFIPPLDLTTLHEHVDSTDPIPARKAQFTSYHRPKKQAHSDDDEENTAVISPWANKLKKKSNVPLNTDIPPSPPVEQDQYKKHSTGSLDDEQTIKFRQLTKRTQGLKKKIKRFEEAFENEHGYKPSHSEKAARPEVKKHMVELGKARKEIKKLKEEAEMGSRSRHGSGASSTGERSDPPDYSPTMADTLDAILKRLHEKRREASRPEDMDMMVPDQIQEEKLAVQKALLHFESVHGRPKTKFEKDLMRPLYDRYRNIKRKIGKMPLQPQSKLELQTVPEDQPFELEPESAQAPPLKSPIHVPTAEMDDDEEHDMLVTGDFMVTQDFGILRDTVRPFTKQNREITSPKAKRKLQLEIDAEDDCKLDSMNLHELSMPELQDEVFRCRNQKKRLQKMLRHFESDFLHQNGRKVQKEDRTPMQNEYQEYKQVKAKLKLLEALLSKYQQSIAV
ncbi:hypothetical protein ScPMuIL_004809 [Solemya velum]